MTTFTSPTIDWAARRAEDKAYNDKRRAETAERVRLLGARLGLDLSPDAQTAAAQVSELFAAVADFDIWRKTIP
jgi:hypothetical protein